MQIFFFVATGEGKEEMMTEIFQKELPFGSLHKVTALHVGSSFGLLISCHNQSLRK
jgi:hypothetical protein